MFSTIEKNRYVKLTVFFFLFILGVNGRLYALELSDAEFGRATSEFINLCASTEVERLAYCEGYIDGALHFWKLGNDQISYGKSDKSLEEPWNMGMEDAMRDMFLHLYGSGEFHKFRPCIGADLEPQQAKHLLFEFLISNLITL